MNENTQATKRMSKLWKATIIVGSLAIGLPVVVFVVGIATSGLDNPAFGMVLALLVFPIAVVTGVVLALAAVVLAIIAAVRGSRAARSTSSAQTS